MENRKALVVGIDNYESAPLAGCCNDSAAVSGLLAKHDNGSPNFAVQQINNIESKSELKTRIIECFAGDADVALFYFSGHGYIDSVGGYLVTPDFTPNDYGVSLAEVLTIANQSTCKEKIIILDCCYSGFAGSICTSGQDTATICQGVTILTASLNSEYAVEVEGHGVFTALLIEALKGGAADITGHITAGGIYAFIDKALGPWDQRPTFKTNVARFTSLRDVEPQVGIEIIRKLALYFSSDGAEFSLDPSFEPTNTPDYEFQIVEPYADNENTRTFADLQQLESIGLVAPTNEKHMYYAAMNTGSCHLTPTGKQYWRLVKDGKI